MEREEDAQGPISSAGCVAKQETINVNSETEGGGLEGSKLATSKIAQTSLLLSIFLESKVLC